MQNPPYFDGMTMTPAPVRDINGARVLALFGDSITTDHISPAGSIKRLGPAGHYLQEHQVRPKDFNSYGSRRGNHEVMERGTFANIRIRNEMMAARAEGGNTIHQPSGERMSIFDAAMRYQAEGTPLVVIGGKEYGTGSSRDWAAKGPKLLGVRAVITESFERIHRSNLIGMGVLPLVFEEGTSWDSLGSGATNGSRSAAWARPEAAPDADRRDQARRRPGEPRAAHVPHRHAGRARIFPQRRNSALRVAAPGELIDEF